MSSEAKTTDRQKQKAPEFREVVRLMRLECDRAQRHGYPLSCILIAPDGLEIESRPELRRRLMATVFGHLKRVAYQHQAQGLGGWTDHCILAMFPHFEPDSVGGLAEALRESVRAIELPDGLDPVTLSIGVSHNQHEGPMSFEILIQEADTGLSMARNGGGDRCVQWLEVETELTRLRDELEAQMDQARQNAEDFEREGEFLGDRWGQELLVKLVQLFEEEPEQSTGVVRLKKETIALLHAEIADWRESALGRQLSEANRRATQLERRVGKLSHLLQVTEGELRRVAAMKSVDTGVASIYRTVQGLGDEADNAEQKKEIMKSIFEANLALLGRQPTQATQATQATQEVEA